MSTSDMEVEMVVAFAQASLAIELIDRWRQASCATIVLESLHKPYASRNMSARVSAHHQCCEWHTYGAIGNAEPKLHTV